jgi:hypothetical protein
VRQACPPSVIPPLSLGTDDRWELLPACAPALAEPPEPPPAPLLAGMPPGGSSLTVQPQHPPHAESPYSSVSLFAPSAPLPPDPGTPGATPPPSARKRPPPPPPGAAAALGLVSALKPLNVSPQSSPPADAHSEEDVHAPDGLRNHTRTTNSRVRARAVEQSAGPSTAGTFNALGALSTDEPRKERKIMKFWNRDRDKSKERDKGKDRDVETPLPADLVRMIGEHPRPMSLSSSFHDMPSVLFLGLLTRYRLFGRHCVRRLAFCSRSLRTCKCERGQRQGGCKITTTRVEVSSFIASVLQSPIISGSPDTPNRSLRCPLRR